jgi:hypothetical protein
MRSEMAREVSDLLQDISKRLDESLAQVRDKYPAEDFEKYRRTVGKIMGEILIEGLNPLYKEHPDLKPPAWYP